MKKLLLMFIVLVMTLNTAQAKSDKNIIQSVIKNSGADKTSVAVSVKDLRTGNTTAAFNDKILMNPASLQKALTLPSAVNKLGENYVFKTSLYKRGENEYVIKLSGDPSFTSKDLKKLVSQVNEETKTIYIDDSVLDSNVWGEGWQWDDDMNVYMPRFGAYNINKNIVKITLIPSSDGQAAIIANSQKYPFLFTNNVKTSDTTKIDVKRDTALSANGIIFSGTISKPAVFKIPVNNIKRNFEFELTKILEEKNVYIKNPYMQTTVKSTDKLISSVEHSLSGTIDDILKNSSNMTAETVFKLSGGGSAEGGVKVFEEFCKNNNLDPSQIRITDGSGVSKNNLVSADFVTEYLYKNKDNPVLNHLPAAGEGTLAMRMLPLKDKLKAKTGTLSNVSSLAGYLTTKNGNQYCFCILQNDVKMSESDKKMLEDYIVKELYLRG